MKFYFKIIIFVIYLFVASNASAQKNLVPNWSFEEFIACPNSSNFSCFFPSITINSVKDWFCVDWYLSPNYFNVCSSVLSQSVPANGYGYQYPKTGNAYMNGLMYYQNKFLTSGIWGIEYIECQLKSKLDTNKIYCVKYYVSRSGYDGCKGISGFGALLSGSIINTYNPLNGMVPGTAQVKNPLTNIITDTKNWSVISGTFTANGNEQFLTIGNFHL